MLRQVSVEDPEIPVSDWSGSDENQFDRLIDSCLPRVEILRVQNRNCWNQSFSVRILSSRLCFETTKVLTDAFWVESMTLSGTQRKCHPWKVGPAGTGYGNFSDGEYELNGAIDPEELIRQRQEELEAMQNEMGSPLAPLKI